MHDINTAFINVNRIIMEHYNVIDNQDNGCKSIPEALIKKCKLLKNFECEKIRNDFNQFILHNYNDPIPSIIGSLIFIGLGKTVIEYRIYNNFSGDFLTLNVRLKSIFKTLLSSNSNEIILTLSSHFDEKWPPNFTINDNGDAEITIPE